MYHTTQVSSTFGLPVVTISMKIMQSLHLPISKIHQSRKGTCSSLEQRSRTIKHGIQYSLLSITSSSHQPKSVDIENVRCQGQKGKQPCKLPEEVYLRTTSDMIEAALKEVLSKFRSEREVSRITARQNKSQPYLIHPWRTPGKAAGNSCLHYPFVRDNEVEGEIRDNLKWYHSMPQFQYQFLCEHDIHLCLYMDSTFIQ